MPTAAAIYARISQDRTGQGLGVGRQEEDCRAWAGRHGWTVAELYADDDISAYSGKTRPGYKRMLSDIGDGRRDALIVWHPDRLHRSTRELEDFIALVERTGITIGTVQAGDLDLATPTGRMTARIVGAVARHESEHKAERIRRKALELAQNGQVPGGGIRPFGYEKDRVTVRDDEAELIREAAARVLAGDGVRTVAADWQRRGIKTVTGADWQGTTIKRMLRSGRIAGWREHHGRWIAEAEWPAIIDPNDGRRLRKLLDDPARSNGAPTGRSYLLSGFIYCGLCGAQLIARPVRRKGIRYRRYACVTDRGGCNRCGIGAEPLEELIVEAVMHRLDTAKLAKAVAKRRKQAAAPVNDVADIEGRLEDLAAMFAAGEIGRSEWATARKGLMDRLTVAQQAEAAQVRTTAVDDQLAAPDVLRREWPDLSLDRQRTIIGAVIDRVTIAGTTKGGNKFNADRVDVTWKA